MSKEFINRFLSSIVLIPILLYVIVKGSYIFNLFILVCLIISLYEWTLMRKKKSHYFSGVFFLFFSFYTIYKLRNNFDVDYLYILLICVVCIFTDVGGYVFGKIFKGPKLTKLSPNKTFSGMFGSYILSLLSVAIIFHSDLIFFKFQEMDLINLLFVILVSTISQLGDIFVSYFKRLSKIKDTGKIIPGHGGLLDRVDGMIFAFPFSYIVFSTNIFKYF